MSPTLIPSDGNGYETKSDIETLNSQLSVNHVVSQNKYSQVCLNVCLCLSAMRYD